MNEKKISDSQKAAQKRYDQKTKMVSVKYTLSEMEDYIQLKEYLEKTNQSMNGFIKGLVKSYFASGQGTIYEKPLEKKLHGKKTYDNYENITLNDIQPLIDRLGRLQTQMILSKYERIFENTVKGDREKYETKLLIWLKELINRVDQGEFNNMDGIERSHMLRDELIELLK